LETISNSDPLISILLVEDDKDAREILVTIFARKFPDVSLYSAGNGRTGLELFKEHKPDIVITDLNMPEMGGIQMAYKIREIKPDTKFIVLTGNSGKVILENGDGVGLEFDCYIQKPVDFAKLFAAIEKCLGELARQV
jgi:YesN/AraC family two-component response regulator